MTRHFSLFAVVLFCLLLAVPFASAQDAPAAKTKVLLVTGVDYPGHKWRETTPALREAIEADGTAEVRVVEDHEFLASDAIFDYDAIVLNMKNYDPTARMDQVAANLMQYVEEGGGISMIHFTCGAFPEWPEWKQLAGRNWDETKRGHDPRGPFTVVITDPEHPIVADMEDFEADDELYTCLSDDGPEIHVIATATSKVDGKDYPIAFVMDIGEGRVFHTVLGHDVKAIALPGPSELIRNGCLWTAGD